MDDLTKEQQQLLTFGRLLFTIKIREVIEFLLLKYEERGIFQ